MKVFPGRETPPDLKHTPAGSTFECSSGIFIRTTFANAVDYIACVQLVSGELHFFPPNMSIALMPLKAVPDTDDDA
jgi:hypothetical protein